MARSVLAVLIGYLTFGIPSGLLFQLSGRDPHVFPETSFLVFSVAFGSAVAFLGGFLAATVTLSSRFGHALAVAIVIEILAGISLAVHLAGGAAIAGVWSEIATILVMSPACIAGGLIRSKVGAD